MEKSYSRAGGSPRAQALAKGTDGSYFIAGSDSTEALIVKVKANFDVEWERYLKGAGALHEAHTVVATNDGGAVIAGHTHVPKDQFSSVDVPFATRLDKNGRVLWTKTYGTHERLTGTGRFACGINTDDGVLLVGTRYKLWTGQQTEPYTTLGSELTVTQLSDKGEVNWETSIWQDGDELVAPSYLTQRDCSVLNGPSRDIVFAIAFEANISISKTGDHTRWRESGLPSGERHRVLVSQIDARGTERTRTRLSGNHLPRLFKTPSGYALITTSTLASQPGVRYTALNGQMSIVSQRTTSDPRSFFYMETAVADEDGGFHIAGYRVVGQAETGRVAIAHLDSAGALRDERIFGSGSPSWEPVAMSPGEDPAEFIVLQRGRDGYDIRLMKLRYSR